MDLIAPQSMVEEQIIMRGIKDPDVIKAFLQVAREEFVPNQLQSEAYNDSPLPLGYGQTISQPYIVAFMTKAAGIKSYHKVLEIGTGCGYQTAILAELAKEVFTIELVEPLGKEAQKRLKRLGYNNIKPRIGNGYKGWPEEAPFDAIIVTSAPERIPQSLLEQLKIGGRLIIPVGTYNQELLHITRTSEGLKQENLTKVRFVPMVKEIQ